MCLVVFAVDAHARYPLVLGANRDEFHARPTASAGWWEEEPSVLAGRDLQGGGTWMGIRTDGRWAALTNHRDPARERAGAPSRGALVKDFLLGPADPLEYGGAIAPEAGRYNGFNLLAGTLSEVYWLSNRAARAAPTRVAPGIHGLSNHLLDTPWPKVERARRALADLLVEPDLAPDRLLTLLLDRTRAADSDLPRTGVATELERALSPMFISTEGYGTRSSTALLVDREGRARFIERSYAPGGERWTDRTFEFQLEPAAGTDLRR